MAEHNPNDGDRDSSSGDHKDDKPKVLTEEEHARRMRGLAKEKEKADAELAQLRKEREERLAAEKESERKKLEEQGEYKSLLSRSEAAQKAAEERAAAAEAQLSAHLEEINDSNKERIKALPDEAKELVKDLAKELSPVALAKHLTRVEATFAGGGERVRDVSGRGGRKGPEDKDAKKKANAERGKAWVFGGGDK